NRATLPHMIFFSWAKYLSPKLLPEPPPRFQPLPFEQAAPSCCVDAAAVSILTVAIAPAWSPSAASKSKHVIIVDWSTICTIELPLQSRQRRFRAS
ncbi:hypothetical protein PIB30_061854, partial [Stylosanthes scabra]|nr:hypothetical protein [Stylosanthes scabra]